MRKYIVYVDDGSTCHRIAVPAASEIDARNATDWNGTPLAKIGEIVSVRDVTERYRIDADDVYDALESAHFGKEKIEFVIKTLLKENIAS